MLDLDDYYKNIQELDKRIWENFCTTLFDYNYFLILS